MSFIRFLLFTTRNHRSTAHSIAPIVPSLPLLANYFLIVTGKDGGAPNKERPSPQASPCMAVVAMAAATTTILALVAGLVAALRMIHMSADRRSGTSESVANITKADNNYTIKVA